MKKLYSFFSIMLLVSLFLGAMATMALAGGGQNTNQERGEEGAGTVSQYCIHPDESGICSFGN